MLRCISLSSYAVVKTDTVIFFNFPKISTHAPTLRVNTMPSARRSMHMMPAACVMTTVLHTRSRCVRPTQLRSKTSASVCWTYAGVKATTPSIIREAAQVRIYLKPRRLHACITVNRYYLFLTKVFQLPVPKHGNIMVRLFSLVLFSLHSFSYMYMLRILIGSFCCLQ